MVQIFNVVVLDDFFQSPKLCIRDLWYLFPFELCESLYKIIDLFNLIQTLLLFCSVVFLLRLGDIC